MATPSTIHHPRIALITGGTRGIGESISVAFKKAGYKVAANYAHNHEAAQKFNKRTKIPIYSWNVADFGECVKGAEKVAEDLGGPIEILINNAGITRDSMLHKMDADAWDAVIKTNLYSCFNMSRAVVGAMRERGFGRIINISSINAITGQMGQTNYSAAKAGVLGFTKALARENAAKGITVNSVAPGYIDTDMVKAVPEAALRSIIAQIPVGRLGKPEEVAHCALFLAAEESSFITGETLSVNGGHHME